MSRYIDADALHDALKAKQKWVVRCGDKHNEGYTYDQVHFAIDDAPSIDIVRCKECKHWHQEINESGVEYVNFSKCTKGHYGNGLDFHCADGEREGE